jgi:hypothetical protein
MVTLRRYFPRGDILGCDLDLALSAGTPDLPGPVFLSTPEAVKCNGPYDLIFANSVLCLKPTRGHLPDLFPFTEFVSLAHPLHEALQPSGLLCLYNVNYLFSELAFAAEYRPIRSEQLVENGFVGKWHSSGIRLSQRQLKDGVDRQVILRPDLTTNDSFRDCIFEKAVGGPVNVHLDDFVDPTGFPAYTPISIRARSILSRVGNLAGRPAR